MYYRNCERLVKDYKQELENRGYQITILDQDVYPVVVTHPDGRGGRFWTLESAYEILIAKD